ncbi:uncharacterized protein LOC124580841 [Schistocerca americana]|uniref:uncharacterized protein LOC124580841 n=1 Tax=Schistocerca americana TaxID=7009 RepID=UPI001F4FB78E|nr:uncharacterized protein LOC124580841 [Schistocerca americana]
MTDAIDCVIYPLTYCVNKSLDENKFNEKLKISRVVPVYKKVEKNCPTSYRLISITPFFLNFLNTNFGFREGKCTTDSMNSQVKFVLVVFEAWDYAPAMFCDLSRAFDCVEQGFPTKFSQGPPHRT